MQALNPIIGIDPRVEVFNLDPAEKVTKLNFPVQIENKKNLN